MKRILVAAVAVVATAAWAQDTQTSTMTELPDVPVQTDAKTEDMGAPEMDTQAGLGGAGEAGQGTATTKNDPAKPGMAKPETQTGMTKPEMTKPDVMAQSPDTAAQKKSGGMLTQLGVMVPADMNQFLNHLAHGNDMELKMAELAKERATSKAVKSHAERMLKDHTAMKQKVEALAQKEGLTLAAPTHADDRDKKMHDAHLATMAKLEIMEGKAFDQAYLTAMLEGHDLTIAKAMVATEQFRDTELSKLLKKELPLLMEHRTMTYTLLGKEKPNLAAMRGMTK